MEGIKSNLKSTQAPIEEKKADSSTTPSSTISEERSRTCSESTLRQHNTIDNVTSVNLNSANTVPRESSNHRFINEAVKKILSLIQRCEDNKDDVDKFQKSFEATKNYFDEVKKQFPKSSIITELDKVMNQVVTNFKEIENLLIQLIDKEKEFNTRLNAAFQATASSYAKNSLPLIEKMYHEQLSNPQAATLPSRKAYDQTVDQLDAELRETHNPKMSELENEMHHMKLRVGFLDEENGLLLNQCKTLIDALQK